MVPYGKGKNLTEFKNAMKLHAIPMFNTGYADLEGNIYYVYNAKIPKRDPRYNWKKVLPGESKRTLWYDYVPYDELPQVLNPFEGFFKIVIVAHISSREVRLMLPWHYLIGQV